MCRSRWAILTALNGLISRRQTLHSHLSNRWVRLPDKELHAYFRLETSCPILRTMQFVKSSVYQAEITEGGVREREVDTRSREEVELQERLRRLPEFSRSKYHQ